MVPGYPGETCGPPPAKTSFAQIQDGGENDPVKDVTTRYVRMCGSSNVVPVKGYPGEDCPDDAKLAPPSDSFVKLRARVRGVDPVEDVTTRWSRMCGSSALPNDGGLPGEECPDDVK